MRVFHTGSQAQGAVFQKRWGFLEQVVFCGFIRLCIMVDLLHLPLGYFFFFRAAHGTAFALLLWSVCVPKQHRTAKTHNIGGAYVSFAAIVWHQPFLSRIWSEERLEQVSDTERLASSYRVAENLLADFWLIGTGQAHQPMRILCFLNRISKFGTISRA